MQTTTIRLCYRKIIDATAQRQWDKYVWEDTHRELVMQSQIYNADKKYRLYSELIKGVKEAENLPFLVSTALVGYLKQLNGMIPDITNVLSKTCLPFKNYKFEIIESDLVNNSLHKVAVEFISEPLTWHDTINNSLLISVDENRDANDDAMLTDMITMQPFLSIFSVKKVPYDTAIQSKILSLQ